MRSTPRSCASITSRIMVLMPPMPEPMITPVRSAKILVGDRVLHAGVAQRLGGRGPGEVDVAVVAAHFLLGHHRVRLEAAHLAGDLAVDAAGVERGDAVDAAAAGDQPFPERRHVVAERRDGAHAGHDHPPLIHRRCRPSSTGRGG